MGSAVLTLTTEEDVHIYVTADEFATCGFGIPQRLNVSLCIRATGSDWESRFRLFHCRNRDVSLQCSVIVDYRCQGMVIFCPPPTI